MFQKPISTHTATKLPIEQEAWLFFRFDDLEVIRLRLAPRERMENHINDWRIIFYVLRGAGSLEVEGSGFELKEGQSIAVEAGKQRFWSNPGNQALELLVIKTRKENVRDI